MAASALSGQPNLLRIRGVGGRGDYGAASVVGGDVWLASEYIGQRCTLAQ